MKKNKKQTDEAKEAKSFVLDQSYENILEEVSELPITATKRLSKTTFFRVCPFEGYSKVPVLTVDDPRGMGDKMCIVMPDAVAQLDDIADNISTKWAYLVISRSGGKKVMLITAITELNKDSDMLVNRAKIFEEAKKSWLRMTWDKSERMHRKVFPKYDIPDPDWGELPSMVDILLDAFESRFIENADHDLVQYLLGGP